MIGGMTANLVSVKGIIAGIDPGTKRLGFALYDPKTDRFLDVGWRGFVGDSLMARLHSVRLIVREILPKRTEATLVAVERMFSKANSADFALAVVSYFVQERAWRLGIRCVQVATGTAKAAATGSGRADKREVRAVLKARYEGEYTEDEADAMAVCLGAVGM